MFKKITGFVLTICIFLAGCNESALKKTQTSEPDRKIRIVLVGDSTVTEKQGWGVGFKQFLTDRAECINTAAGGRSSKSFINEGRRTQRMILHR